MLWRLRKRERRQNRIIKMNSKEVFFGFSSWAHKKSVQKLKSLSAIIYRLIKLHDGTLVEHSAFRV